MNFTDNQTNLVNINLLVTLDQNYIKPLTVMLKSYVAVHTDVITELYIAHSSLEEEHFSLIEKAIDNKNVRIHNIKITEKYFSDTPVLERLPEESFYRLLAFDFLPESIDRCLYLDPDILIRKSLLPLYNTDMDEAYIAAASHMHGFLNWFNTARLGLIGEKYINSGVILMNLKAIRKDFTVEHILKCLEENTQRLIMGDQDLINILFGAHTIFIDEHIYNLDERTYKYYKKKKGFTLADAEEITAIVHYNGKYKPWLNGYKGELDRFYPEILDKGTAPKKVLRGEIKFIYTITRLSTKQIIALAGTLLFIVLCIFSFFFLGNELKTIISEPEIFRMWLDSLGEFDEAVFILIRSLETIVKFIPAEPLEIGAGYAWGAVRGMLYCIIGNMIGTIAIFALTKKFGDKIINIFFPNRNNKLLAIFNTSNKIYMLLFTLYLIPGIPKDGLTYLVGLLPVKPIPFMIVTGIARIPSVLSLTICGATLADKQYLISGVIFAATILLAFVGVFVCRGFFIKTNRIEKQHSNKKSKRNKK